METTRFSGILFAKNMKEILERQRSRRKLCDEVGTVKEFTYLAAL